MKRVITKQEWWWLAAFSVIALLVSGVPYIVGWMNSSPENVFGGFVFGLEDLNSYVAKMRYAAYAPGWNLELVYTLEPHRGGFVYAYYVTLGKLTALMSAEGGNPSASTLIAAYHIARIVFGGLLLVVMYCFITEFINEVNLRRLAWVIAVFGSGLGWVLLPVGLPGFIPVSFYLPESYSWLLIYGLPHLALARALLLGGWIVLFRAIDSDSWWLAMAAGVCWMLMGIIVPFFAALLGVLIAMWLLALLIVRREIPWGEFRLAAVAGVLPVLVLLYFAWLFNSDPVLNSWGLQNILKSPPVVDYVLAYIVVLALAVPGAVLVVRGGLSSRPVLLLSWPVTGFLLAYIPINVQRRLLEGIILPLAVLAAVGFGWLAKQIGSRRWRPVLLSVLLILILPGTMILTAGGVSVASSGGRPVFSPEGEQAALAWLHDNAPTGSHVLATFNTGNIIPAYANVRVYTGHGPETVNAVEKAEIAEQFYLDPDYDSKDRRDLLEDQRIDYVFVGLDEQSEECNGPCFDPEEIGLQVVYESGEYAIYEVVR